MTRPERARFAERALAIAEALGDVRLRVAGNLLSGRRRL